MKLTYRNGCWAFAVFLLMALMTPNKGWSLETVSLAGEACEGDHLSDFEKAKPIYKLRIVIQKGLGVDRLKLEDVENDGNVFSVQTVDFDGGLPKSFVSTNPLLEQVNKLTVTDKELILEATKKSETKTARFARPKLFAVGPSLNRIITDYLADLEAGKSVSFQMVIVDRLTLYGFRLKKEKVDDHEALPQVKSGEWVKLRMEIEDPLFGVFAPTIFFIVDAKTGLPYYVNSPIPSPKPGEGLIGRGTIHYEVVR